jgi:hypothetical protein
VVQQQQQMMQQQQQQQLQQPPDWGWQQPHGPSTPPSGRWASSCSTAGQHAPL